MGRHSSLLFGILATLLACNMLAWVCLFSMSDLLSRHISGKSFRLQWQRGRGRMSVDGMALDGIDDDDDGGLAADDEGWPDVGARHKLATWDERLDDGHSWSWSGAVTGGSSSRKIKKRLRGAALRQPSVRSRMARSTAGSTASSIAKGSVAASSMSRGAKSGRKDLSVRPGVAVAGAVAEVAEVVSEGGEGAEGEEVVAPGQSGAVRARRQDLDDYISELSEVEDDGVAGNADGADDSADSDSNDGGAQNDDDDVADVRPAGNRVGAEQAVDHTDGRDTVVKIKCDETQCMTERHTAAWQAVEEAKAQRRRQRGDGDDGRYDVGSSSGGGSSSSSSGRGTGGIGGNRGRGGAGAGSGAQVLRGQSQGVVEGEVIVVGEGDEEVRADDQRLGPSSAFEVVYREGGLRSAQGNRASMAMERVKAAFSAVYPPYDGIEYPDRMTAANQTEWPLWWFAPFFDRTSFGKEAATIIMGILRHAALPQHKVWIGTTQGACNDDVDSSIPLQDFRLLNDAKHRANHSVGAIVVCHSLPPFWARPKNKWGTCAPCPPVGYKAPYAIGRAMAETDVYHREFVRICNTMDEVWVPSAFSADVMVASGLPADKIRIVPIAVNTTLYDPAAHVPLPLPVGELVFGRRRRPFDTHRSHDDLFAAHKADDALQRLPPVLRSSTQGAAAPQQDVALSFPAKEAAAPQQDAALSISPRGATAHRDAAHSFPAQESAPQQDAALSFSAQGAAAHQDATLTITAQGTSVQGTSAQGTSAQGTSAQGTSAQDTTASRTPAAPSGHHHHSAGALPHTSSSASFGTQAAAATAADSVVVAGTPPYSTADPLFGTLPGGVRAAGDRVPETSPSDGASSASRHLLQSEEPAAASVPEMLPSSHASFTSHHLLQSEAHESPSTAGELTSMAGDVLNVPQRRLRSPGLPKLGLTGRFSSGENVTTEQAALEPITDGRSALPTGEPVPTSALVNQMPLPFTLVSTFKWETRKGWDILLHAYLSEFTSEDNVELYILTKPFLTGGNFIGDMHRWSDEHLHTTDATRALLPSLYVISGHVELQYYNELYRAADAFVMPTRGEGWGMPITEAMSMGLPVIVTNWSGVTAFVDDSVGYLVDYDLVPVPPHEPWWFRGARWAECRVSHLRQVLRHVYEHRAEAHEKGRRARERMVTKYSPQVIAKQVAAEHERIEGWLRKGNRGSRAFTALDGDHRPDLYNGHESFLQDLPALTATSTAVTTTTTQYLPDVVAQ